MIEITKESLIHAVDEFISSGQFEDIVGRVVDKNNQYGSSWEQIGSFINVSDILDKLKRAIQHGFTHGVEYVKISNAQKFDEIVFDLFVRCLLTMMYREKMLEHIEES